MQKLEKIKSNYIYRCPFCQTPAEIWRTTNIEHIESLLPEYSGESKKTMYELICPKCGTNEMSLPRDVEDEDERGVIRDLGVVFATVNNVLRKATKDGIFSKLKICWYILTRCR